MKFLILTFILIANVPNAISSLPTTCVKEGDTVVLSPSAPTCCEGLTLKPDETGLLGSRGTCVKKTNEVAECAWIEDVTKMKQKGCQNESSTICTGRVYCRNKSGGSGSFTVNGKNLNKQSNNLVSDKWEGPGVRTVYCTDNNCDSPYNCATEPEEEFRSKVELLDSDSSTNCSNSGRIGNCFSQEQKMNTSRQ